MMMMMMTDPHADGTMTMTSPEDDLAVLGKFAASDFADYARTGERRFGDLKRMFLRKVLAMHDPVLAVMASNVRSYETLWLYVNRHLFADRRSPVYDTVMERVVGAKLRKVAIAKKTGSKRSIERRKAYTKLKASTVSKATPKATAQVSDLVQIMSQLAIKTTPASRGGGANANANATSAPTANATATATAAVTAPRLAGMTGRQKLLWRLRGIGTRRGQIAP